MKPSLSLLMTALFLTNAFAAAADSDPCADFDLAPGAAGTVALDRLPVRIFYGYVQQQYQLVDPVGDFALASRSGTTVRNLLRTITGQREKRLLESKRIAKAAACGRMFFGGKKEGLRSPVEEGPVWEPRESELKVIRALQVNEKAKELLLREYLSGNINIVGDQPPISIRGFREMLQQVIFEEFRDSQIEPKLGTVHRWSPEFLREYGARFGITSAFSKLLIALSRGDTAELLTTGKEEALMDAVLAQPLRSVTPESLFRMSYRINEGDVYLSLLAIQNIYATHWRRSDREALAVSRRLIPIVHHFGNHPDNFGLWYHFFGIMLYGYANGAVPAKVVGITETLGSHIVNGFVHEDQENFINAKGGSVGSGLRSFVKKMKYLSVSDRPEAVRTDHYLLADTQDYSKKLKRIARRLFENLPEVKELRRQEEERKRLEHVWP